MNDYFVCISFQVSLSVDQFTCTKYVAKYVAKPVQYIVGN